MRQSTQIENYSQQVEKLQAKIEKWEQELYNFDGKRDIHPKRRNLHHIDNHTDDSTPSIDATIVPLSQDRKQYLKLNISQTKQEMITIQQKIRSLRYESIKTTILSLVITLVILIALHYHQIIDLNQWLNSFTSSTTDASSLSAASSTTNQEDYVREMMRKQQEEIAKGPQWLQ